MHIQQIFEKKKDFLELLLLADEQESMIDRYLERGEMFVLYKNNAVISSCVISNEGKGVFELKNIATYPQYQCRGYGRYLMKFISEHYREKGHTLFVGTGNCPQIISFYESCGFVYSHRIPDFFTLNYDHPIFENGIQLVDMIYLRKPLREITKSTPQDYDKLLQLWEASVRSTHHFLTEQDIQFYKELIPQYLPAVDLYTVQFREGNIAAFMGLSDELIEMLFVHPDEQSKGLGQQLIGFAVKEKKKRKVDVNEQNTTALRFYQRLGFQVIGRDEVDTSGKPFPILHLQLSENAI